MEIVIVIDDKMLEPLVKDYVSKAVHEVVKHVANKKLSEMRNEVESAVDQYLAKHYTDDKIKKMMNDEVKQLLVSRLEEM